MSLTASMQAWLKAPTHALYVLRAWSVFDSHVCEVDDAQHEALANTPHVGSANATAVVLSKHAPSVGILAVQSFISHMHSGFSHAA